MHCSAYTNPSLQDEGGRCANGNNSAVYLCYEHKRAGFSHDLDAPVKLLGRALTGFEEEDSIQASFG